MLCLASTCKQALNRELAPRAGKPIPVAERIILAAPSAARMRSVCDQSSLLNVSLFQYAVPGLAAST